MVVLVAKKNSVEKKGSFFVRSHVLEAVGHFVGWSASIGADWPVVALELFLQVVVGIHASGCHTRIECIDVNVVFVAVTEALHSVDTSESVFLWKNGEMFCDMRVENSCSGPVDMVFADVVVESLADYMIVPVSDWSCRRK